MSTELLTPVPRHQLIMDRQAILRREPSLAKVLAQLTDRQLEQLPFKDPNSWSLMDRAILTTAQIEASVNRAKRHPVSADEIEKCN